MAPRVLWRDAQGREGSVDLHGGEALIGRAMDCAIRTDDAMVSRHHARLIYQGGRYVVEDLGSANGIYYQERRIARHVLQHGDAVRCGSLWLRFLDTSQIPSAAPPHSAGPESGTPYGAAPSSSGVGLRSGKTAHLPAVSQPSAETARPEEPAPTPAPSHLGSGGAEYRHLERRIEQLRSELRIYRGGGDNARTYDELEDEIDDLRRERDQLKRRVRELEAKMELEGASARVRRAGAIADTAAEIVSGLNDVLSNLRINVMAAEGEFEQYAQSIPRASFELIREALRSSAADMESAREMLRELRRLAGVS